MGDPYRQPAPHPDAILCRCGWRQPVKFRPVLTILSASAVEITSNFVLFTCPDCGLEHQTVDSEASDT